MIEAIIGLIGVVLGFGLSAEYQELKEGRERKKHKGALIEELRANLHMIPQKRQTISNMMNELQQGRMLLGLLYIFQERFSKTVSPSPAAIRMDFVQIFTRWQKGFIPCVPSSNYF